MTQAIITKNAKMVADNIIVGVEDAVLRKRLFIYANVIESVADYMATIGFSVSTKSSLYKLTPVSKNFDIADFLVSNARIDVRVIDNVTNAVLIPKSHKEFGIEPDIYIAVKVDDMLKSLDIVGFIPTEQIIFDKEIQNFYVLNTKKLIPLDKFKQLSHSIQIKRYEMEISEKEIFQLLQRLEERSISENSQIMLLHSLFANPAFVKKLNLLQKIDTIAKNLANMPDLLDEFAPVFVQDFADDDLGGMDNIEEVEIFGDEQIIEVPKEKVDEALDELNPEFGKADFEPVFPKQENKPLILHVIAIILVGAILIGLGLGKKESQKTAENTKVNTIQNAVIPNINEDVKNLAWGVSSEISQNKEFINYLNQTGQIVKDELSKKIRVTEEKATEREIKMAVVFDNNSHFKSCVVKKSSGSKEIDKKASDVIKKVFEQNPPENIRTDEPFIRTVLVIKL